MGNRAVWPPSQDSKRTGSEDEEDSEDDEDETRGKVGPLETTLKTRVLLKYGFATGFPSFCF